MVCTPSLEQRLIDTSTTSNNTNSRTCAARHRLLRPTRQTNTSLVVFRRVTDDGGVVPRCASESTAVTDFLFYVADDGTFGALADGEDVADGECGFLTGVDEGTGVQTFGCDECFFPEFVAVGITENDTGKGSTTERLGLAPHHNILKHKLSRTGQSRE